VDGCPTPPEYSIVAPLPMATFSAFGALLPVPMATPLPLPGATSTAPATYRLDNNTPLINTDNISLRLLILSSPIPNEFHV